MCRRRDELQTGGSDVKPRGRVDDEDLAEHPQEALPEGPCPAVVAAELELEGGPGDGVLSENRIVSQLSLRERVTRG